MSISTPQKMRMARMMAKSLMSFLTCVKRKHTDLIQFLHRWVVELNKSMYADVMVGDSQWWGRKGWSWTSSDTWSRCKCQRTGWRTWGWCLGQSHKPSPPALHCTLSTHFLWGTTRWHSLAVQREHKRITIGTTQLFIHYLKSFQVKSCNHWPLEVLDFKCFEVNTD